MKKKAKIFWYCMVALVVVLACTKEIGLVTEVEFELLQQRTTEGFINQGLPTTLTILPEAELEGYTYSFTYQVLQGGGYFEDANGMRLASGDAISFSPLSASLLYVGNEEGEHVVKVVGSDNFGFKEELEITYMLTDVPVSWTASSPISQIELGESAPITLGLETPTVSDVTYEAAYNLSAGSGTLTLTTANGFLPTTEYEPILPGTYELSFIPDALGSVEIIFLVRDTNGQELSATVIFEVVETIDVISLNLGEHDALNMVVGETLECPLEFNPTNASDQTVNWSSSNPSIVSVNAQGVFTALSEGTAIVTVTSVSNPSATASVTVTVSLVASVPVTGITVAQEDPSATGPIRQLIATVLPANATDSSVLWSSSDENIATVDSNGLLTGVSAGFVTITATSVSNPEISGSIQVNISGGAPTNGTDILAFALPIQNSASIDADNHVITVNVNESTNLNVAPATLTVSQGASIAPNADQVRNFSAPVLYTVTAANGDQQVWTVNVTVSASSEKEITSFSLAGVSGNINGANITLNLPFGTATTQSPSIGFVGASIDPGNGVLQDFSNPVVYTVTAADGSTIQYTVTVSVAASTAKTIDSFTINGVAGSIVGTDISLNLPVGTGVTALTPAISFTGASISPTSGTPQNFTDPVTYTVTAEDGSQQPYLVTVTVQTPTNEAPNAVASANVLSGEAPLTVNFTGDQSSDPDAGDNLSYLWNFDDNGNSNVSTNPSYTFSDPGTYNVTLTVTDDGTPVLNDATQLTITVTPANQVPTAIIRNSPSIIDGAPDTLNFTGEDSFDSDAGDTIVEYRWDFGDPGSGADNTLIASTPAASHTFNTAGDYTVTLVVVDNRGGISNPETNTVTILGGNNPPEANDDMQTYNAINGNNFTINVLSNDSDIDSDDLTITGVTQPSFGSVSIESNRIRYSFIQGINFEGVYTFNYTIEDGRGGTDTATVTVTLVFDCPSGFVKCFGGDGYECIADPGGGSPLICPDPR